MAGKLKGPDSFKLFLIKHSNFNRKGNYVGGAEKDSCQLETSPIYLLLFMGKEKEGRILIAEGEGKLGIVHAFGQSQ